MLRVLDLPDMAAFMKVDETNDEGNMDEWPMTWTKVDDAAAD